MRLPPYIPSKPRYQAPCNGKNHHSICSIGIDKQVWNGLRKPKKEPSKLQEFDDHLLPANLFWFIYYHVRFMLQCSRAPWIWPDFFQIGIGTHSPSRFG